MPCFASFPKTHALVIMGSCKYNVLETVFYTKPLFSTCIACGDFTCEDISVCHNHQQLVFFHASMWHHFTSYGPRIKLWIQDFWRYFLQTFPCFYVTPFYVMWSQNEATILLQTFPCFCGTPFYPIRRVNHLTLVRLWSQGFWRSFHKYPNFRFSTVVESGSGHSCIK